MRKINIYTLAFVIASVSLVSACTSHCTCPSTPPSTTIVEPR